MIKKTYKRLSKEKKSRILKSAIKEFSEYPYHLTSIDRLCKDSNIAKGSFYQYFDNKEDIICIILDEIIFIKDRYFEDLLDKIPENDFTENFKIIYKKNREFSKNNPEITKVLYNLSFTPDLNGELSKKIRYFNEKIFKVLLFHSFKKEELNSKLEIDLLLEYMVNFENMTSLYIFNKQEQEKNSEEELNKLYDQFEILLTRGICGE